MSQFLIYATQDEMTIMKTRGMQTLLIVKHAKMFWSRVQSSATSNDQMSFFVNSQHQMFEQ